MREVMITNYVTTAIRHLRKHPGFATINVLGLSVGMATALLVGLFIRDELSFDRHHVNADRIVRLATEARLGGQDFAVAVTPAPLAEALVDGFPEVEAAVRIQTGPSGSLVRYGEQHIIEDNIAYSDPSILDVFSIPLVQGDAQTALASPNTVIVSSTTAHTFFDDSDPIGKVLRIGEADFQVTGVMEDMPATGHFRFDLLLSMSSYSESRDPSWLSSNFHTYALLRSPDAAASLEDKLDVLVRDKVGPQVGAVLGVPFDDVLAGGGAYSFVLQPLTTIHLHSHLDAEIQANADVTYLYVLWFIAIFILVIASINFMNLATARAAERGREIGVRKVAGADRRQLLTQFLAESVLLALLSMVVAVLAVWFALPFFNTLAGKSIVIPFAAANIWYGLLLLVLIVGLMAGGYPAVFLSSLKPITVLKGSRGAIGTGAALRRGLVVFQFGLSILLIFCTLVMSRQIDFVQTKHLGFDREHLVTFERTSVLQNQTDVFREAVEAIPGVVSASASTSLPGHDGSNTSFQIEGAPADEIYPMYYVGVDESFSRTLDLTVVDGRFFSPEIAGDENGIVINEAALRNTGLTNPVGQRLILVGPTPEETVPYTIIGVVKDFNFESLRHSIRPLVLAQQLPWNPRPDFVTVRLETGDRSQTLSALGDVWNQFAPDEPMLLNFVDSKMNSLYQQDQRVGRLFIYSAGLAILVACLGLFGLAAFTAERRTKEIGIRKVLGATPQGIVGLLTSEFVKLVLIALVISTPIAYFIATRWLNGFAYHIRPGLIDLLTSGGLALLLTIATVSYLAVRAATSNPTKSLRYE